MRLVVFDLETTGVNVAEDRIVQIAYVVLEDWKIVKEGKALINPTIPIPDNASEVHGIYDKDVKDAPTFKDIAQSLLPLFSEKNLGGYNSNRFDIPLLIHEFTRCGIQLDVSDKSLVDVMSIEAKANPRTLEAVYKRYTGDSLEGAHDALADVKGTIKVLEHQIKEHGLEDDPSKLESFYRDDVPRLDITGKFVMDGDKVCFSFGKHRGDPIEHRQGYLRWMLTTDLLPDAVKIIKDHLK